MSAHTLTVEQLQRGLQSLPQEMYDEIFDLTFTFSSNSDSGAGVNTIMLSASYKPPVQQQVSHQTRRDFIETYYSQATLLVSGWKDVYSQFSGTTGKWVERWLRSLPKEVIDILTRAQSRDGRYLLTLGRRLRGRRFRAYYTALQGPDCDLCELKISMTNYPGE